MTEVRRECGRHAPTPRPGSVQRLAERELAAMLADVVDLLRGAPAPRLDRERLPQSEQLSPSELRVLRFLPTNLTRPEIARSLDVSVNTVNTHIRSIYSELGASDRSSAGQQARELRLLAIGRAASLPK